jgi:DNA repair exonuclease SbcCD nuclease subunit
VSRVLEDEAGDDAVKIVVVSDLHGDKDTLGVSRFEEVERALTEASNFAIEHEADAFLCLGDISDPDTGGAAYRSMCMVIECALDLDAQEIPSIWIAGNHDVWEDGSGLSTLSPLAKLAEVHDMIHVAERPMMFDLGGKDVDDLVRVLCLPFTPVSHNYDPRAYARAAFAELPKGLKMLTAGHLMIAGVVPGEETTEMPRGRDVAFPVEETTRSTMRLNGHYHHRQTTAEGIIIPGSICRLTFADEKHEPGFLVIEI